MTKINWTKVNKNKIMSDRGFDYVTSETPKKSIYDQMPLVVSKSPMTPVIKTKIIVRRETAFQRNTSRVLTDKEKEQLALLEKRLGCLLLRIKSVSDRKKETCGSLLDQLLNTIKEMILIDPTKEKKPLSQDILAAYKKLQSIISG